MFNLARATSSPAIGESSTLIRLSRVLNMSTSADCTLSTLITSPLAGVPLITTDTPPKSMAESAVYCVGAAGGAGVMTGGTGGLAFGSVVVTR
ncbi:hypothetical protein D3C71_1545690 [compost metagenome]